MTQNEKDILLKDLCVRLPYGVKFVIDNDQNNVRTLNGIREDIPYEDWQMCVFARGISAIPIEDIRPYIFPLSSMTWEQECQYREVIASSLNHYEVYDWLNKNHFDYRGLIEKGLAIDATGKNIY